MKSCFILIFICYSVILNAQVDTVFFDSDWKISSTNSYEYFRIQEKNKNGYLVKDYYKNGKPQMIFECSTLEPTQVKNGVYQVYYPDGHKRILGQYSNDNPVGTWKWFEENEKDSTVATYNPDGTKHFLHMSKNDLKDESDDKIYELADKMPSFPGGQGSLNRFIKINFNPENKDLKGKFYVSVIVKKDGSLVEPKIIKSLSPEYDAAAIDVINKMPKWIPGEVQNKKVKVRYIIPFAIN